MTDFCYNIRHAYDGDRLKWEFIVGGSRLKYFGFNYTWPDLFFVLAIARKWSERFGHSRIDVTNMMILEERAREALKAFDPKSADYLIRYLNDEMGLANPFIAPASQLLNLAYFRDKPTKRRFRDLPRLIEQHINPSSDLRISFDASCAQVLKSKGGEPHELEVEPPYPEIIW